MAVAHTPQMAAPYTHHRTREEAEQRANDLVARADRKLQISEMTALKVFVVFHRKAVIERCYYTPTPVGAPPAPWAAS